MSQITKYNRVKERLREIDLNLREEDLNLMKQAVEHKEKRENLATVILAKTEDLGVASRLVRMIDVCLEKYSLQKIYVSILNYGNNFILESMENKIDLKVEMETVI